jgi:hypothetical protein
VSNVIKKFIYSLTTGVHLGPIDTTISPDDIVTTVTANVTPVNNLVNAVLTNTSGPPVFINASGSTITINNLSKEEEAELKSLEQEREVAVKQRRIEKFKELPTNMRQTAIDMIKWDSICNDIDNTAVNLEPDKAQRISDLISRRGLTLTNGTSWVSTFTGVSMRIPEGFSLEDLERFHTEACMEEEVLR